MDQKQNVFHMKPGKAAEQLGISTDMVRKYAEHFNIQTGWTKPDNKGQRMYTQANVDEIREIIELIKKEELTWDEALSWRNGDEEIHIKKETRSRLEDRIEDFIENYNDSSSKQEQFNLYLAQQMESFMREFKHTQEQLSVTIEKLEASEKKNAMLEEKIDKLEALAAPADANEAEKQKEKDEARDRLLMESFKTLSQQNKEIYEQSQLILKQQTERKRKKLFGLF